MTSEVERPKRYAAARHHSTAKLGPACVAARAELESTDGQ